MGWNVDVYTEVAYRAVCGEHLPVNPLPPGWGPEPIRCTWTGPIRGSRWVAADDAAAHRAAHARGYRNYNRAIDRENGHQWAHTLECDDYDTCICGADDA